MLLRLSLLLLLLLLTTTTMSLACSKLHIHRLSDKAVLPTRGSPFSAGLDLASAQHLVLPPGQRALVKTDLQIACPPNTYARIAPRSGLALKHGIDVGAGVVDSDYRGPVGVILFNWGDQDFVIQEGDRIAQLIVEQIVLPEVVESDSPLEETVRGTGGFGSTGVSGSKKQKTTSITPSNSSEEADAMETKEE